MQGYETILVPIDIYSDYELGVLGIFPSKKT